MHSWLENPFKAVIAGTGLMIFVSGALVFGIAAVGSFV